MGAALNNIRSTVLTQLSEGLVDMGRVFRGLATDGPGSPRPPEAPEAPEPRRPPDMHFAREVRPQNFLMSSRPKRSISIDGVHAGYIFFDPAYRLDSPPHPSWT